MASSKTGSKPTAEECQQILVQKLNDLKENFEDEKLAFVSTFSLTLDAPSGVDDVNHDPRREEAFLTSTLAGVIKARSLMDEAGIQYQRPPDMFAEMIKSEKEMDSIRDKLQKDVENIQKAQAKNKQKKENNEKPHDNVQKRPGVLMKPKVDPKQKKRDARRAKRKE